VNQVGILGNGHVLTSWDVPTVVPRGAVAWQEGRILAVGPNAEIRAAHPGATYLDAGGGPILPGLVNLHHHFYSALERGLDPRTEMRDFPEILDRLWWRLDRALDDETVALSADLAAADCVRWGCTTVFDHHASPSCVEGSLDLLAGALERAGLSGVLCYEVTDRNGPEGARLGIEENLRFLEERASDARVRGVFGLHASFTVSDATLRRVAELRPGGAGVHIHVAEHPVDVRFSRETFGATPVQRLDRHGLLDDRALLAHGIHVDDADYDVAAAGGATIIHNPESNANNGVGRLDLPRATGRGCAVGLGTDGMSSAVLRALRAAFLGLRGGAGDPTLGFQSVPALLATNARVAGRFLEEPLLGQLVPGAPADVIALDSPPRTPLTHDNWVGHLFYGWTESAVRHTVARGRIVLEDCRHTTVDPVALAARAAEAAPRLWARFHELDWNTAYLGPTAGAGEESFA
jgi:putative selenium metabolism protein SsnA